MPTFLAKKVVATLPETLTKSTLYFVRVADGFDLYVTNELGEIAAYSLNVENLVAALDAEVTALSSRIDALGGRGGPLTAVDLGASPTQESLTAYACEQIFGAGGALAWDADAPWASVYTAADAVEHSVTAIFNATWVRNLNTVSGDWQLANTQDTDPLVFEWVDIGSMSSVVPLGINKIYAPTTTQVVVVFSRPPSEEVTTASWLCYNSSSGDTIPVTAMTGSGTTYTLTVANSVGIGVTYLGA
jgi:hypothetical protein